MSDVKIWRVYNNGDITDETHVLWPHRADGHQCTGYNGDVEAWSEHNKKWRFGCAQIMRKGNDEPVVLYAGYLNTDQLAAAIEKLTAPTSAELLAQLKETEHERSNRRNRT